MLERRANIDFFKYLSGQLSGQRVNGPVAEVAGTQSQLERDKTTNNTADVDIMEFSSQGDKRVTKSMA